MATRRMGSLAYRRTYTGLPWSSPEVPAHVIIACGDKRKQSWSPSFPPPPPHTSVVLCCGARAVVCRFCVVGKQEVLVAEGAHGNARL